MSSGPSSISSAGSTASCSERKLKSRTTPMTSGALTRRPTRSPRGPLPNGLGPAEGARERLVDDDRVGRVRGEGGVEVAPGEEVHAHRLDEVRLDAVDDDLDFLALVR